MALGVALRDTGLSVADVLTLARVAEDAGYSSVWLPEVGSRDAIVLSSLVGAGTRRIQVGTGVVPLYSRCAVTLALSAASAAEASRGRFVLGLGAGHRFTAEGWYGGTWRHPRGRMRETIEVVRRILSGERVVHNGEVRVEGFHLGSTPPDVPIYIGALTPPSLRLTGEIADGAILNWMPPDGMERCALLVHEAAADAGRKACVVGYVRVAVVNNEDELTQARQALRDQTYSYASLPTYAESIRKQGLATAVDDMAAGNEPALDTLVDALCAFGDAGAVRSRLRSFEQAGLDGVVAYPVPFGDDHTSSILRTVRALA
jgi:alkanesulfonate monooxygenase SsuD/methylene tetrahydromethanopterin reductase-like flavin-dependent oxidoreductase (luciferase family)